MSKTENLGKTRNKKFVQDSAESEEEAELDTTDDEKMKLHKTDAGSARIKRVLSTPQNNAQRTPRTQLDQNLPRLNFSPIKMLDDDDRSSNHSR